MQRLAAGTITLAVAALRGAGAIAEEAAIRCLDEAAELRARALLLEQAVAGQNLDPLSGYDVLIFIGEVRS